MIPEQLRKGGFRFIKIRKGEKAPFENDWVNGANYDDQEIEKWIERGNNYGVLCNGDLVVVDTDTAEMEKKLSKVLPATFTIKTSKGFHRYYFCSGFPSRRVPGLDIQSNGKQVVAPGSVHPSGAIYEVVKDLPIQRLSKRELLDIVSEFGIKETNGAVDIDELIKPQTSGNRNDATFKLACFYRKAGWSLARVLEGVREWNKINKPPLPDREIKTIVESAFKGEQYSIYFKQNPLDYGKNADRKEDTQIITHRELMEAKFEPPKWIIPGILGRGHLGVLTGFSGHGKSWVALALAMSASSGKKFLGKYDIEKMSVLYIENENGTYELRRRVEYLGNRERLENLYFAPYPSLDLLESTEWVEKQIEEREISLVVLDSFAGLHAGKENEAEQMRKVLTKLKKIAMDYDVTFVLLLHPNKGNNFKGNNKSFPPDYLDRIRGSSEFRNVADDIIGIHMPNPEDKEFFFEPVKCRTGELQPGEIFGMVFDDEQKTLGFEFVGKKKDYKLGAEKCLDDIVIWATNEAPGGKFTTKDAIDAVDSKWKKTMVNDALKFVREGKCEQICYLERGKYQLNEFVREVRKVHTDNPAKGVQREKQGVGGGANLSTNTPALGTPKLVRVVREYVIADNFAKTMQFDAMSIAINLKIQEKDVEEALKLLEKSGEVAEVSPGMYRRRENG